MKLLYKQIDFPIFQNRVYDTKEEAVNCPKGNIRLIEDEQTGLIYNKDFKSDIIYDNNYQNEQSNSYIFQSHIIEIGTIIEDYIGKENIVELGCGKGFFVEFLLSKGFDIMGFDPVYEGDNEKIKKGYLSDITNPFQGIILRHVLEHISNPFDFLNNIRILNRNSGKIYIEVPCFDWICNHKAWFDIFYEHVNYFRLFDIKRFFDKIIDYGYLFNNQYIYIVAELSSLKKPKIDSNNRINFPNSFLDTYKNNIYSDCKTIWGGSSKGVIFSLLMQRAGFSVNQVIDINPSKQGRYLPATGLYVQSPEEAMNSLDKNSIIYIMNSNYLEEIKEISGYKYIYKTIDNI